MTNLSLEPAPLFHAQRAQNLLRQLEFILPFGIQAEPFQGGFRSGERGDILQRAGAQFCEIQNRRQHRGGLFGPVMKSHSFDQILREIPSFERSGAELSVGQPAQGGFHLRKGTSVG